ncbi:MAG: DNA/RNA non-specific endonuclease, partial [Clostridia bacterium]|nr:DNA/RNA non-specific endonuclease [Clostridia bacterium]
MKKRICLMVMVVMALSSFTSYATYVSGAKAFTYQGIDIPKYKSSAYVKVMDNTPRFTKKEIKGGKQTFERYASLDDLGRAGVCYCSLNKKLMPTYKRGDISMCKPVGWVQAKYSVVPGGWIYNRCHLIGFQLTGIDGVNRPEFLYEDMVTGTRFFNVGKGSGGMVKYENMVAEYLKENPKNHVLYRVTPVYKYKNDLLCRGVLMEGKSVEDSGLSFFVYVYNLQPKVMIDYATGKTKLKDSKSTTTTTAKKKTT